MRQFYVIVLPENLAQSQGLHAGGGSDVGLSELGLQIGAKVARSLKKNPFKLKRIIAGPELRSIQMADLVHDQIKIKMLIFSEFLDQNLGSLEGVSLSSLAQVGERMESQDAFQARVLRGIERMKAEPPEYLLIAHSRVLKVLDTHFQIQESEAEPGRIYSVDAVNRRRYSL